MNDALSPGSAAESAAVSLRLHDKDVGSSQVQIARLTGRIGQLTRHLSVHKKDKHTRRGLIAMISRRRKLTAYLKRSNSAMHGKTLAALGLRKQAKFGRPSRPPFIMTRKSS